MSTFVANRGSTPTRRRSTAVAVLLVVAGLLVAVPSAPAATGQDGATPAFVESSGCGAPATSKPLASRRGWLSDSEALRGPAGDFFGRSVGAIKNSLVWWDVPMSDGERIQVHERALPAFQRVTANLAAEAELGRHYAIRASQTYGFAPRTIGGRYTFSFHAFGTGVDINTRSNPHRLDNVLVTNMPQWFVDAWTEAGFCWGGYWNTSKDAMHFSWMGPAYTPGYGPIPDSYPVTSASSDFSREVQNTTTPFGAPTADAAYVVADASGDAAADVVRVSQNEWGAVIEYSRAGDGHSWCGIRRDHAVDLQLRGEPLLLGDHDGSGRNDLWQIAEVDGFVSLDIRLRSSDFADGGTFPTDLAVGEADAYFVGDYDGDRRSDLFVVRRDATSTAVDVRLGPDFVSGPPTLPTSLGNTTTASFAAGDRDLDGRSDLHVVASGDAGTLNILLAVDDYSAVAETHGFSAVGEVAALAVSDFDGDGRSDLQVLDAAGRFRAFLGNAPVYGDVDGWFVPPDRSCAADAKPYEFAGVFRDDDGNVHEFDIEAIAARDITRGCNPPYGDEYCPTREVTRGEMAAFLARILQPPAATGTDYFQDDDESIFEEEVNRLADIGVARGCNPPDNDRYCPEAVMTRAELAAMLVRALDLDERATGNRFVDDDGSPFEPDIERLAFAGITHGCNPPDNDRFCPTGSVRRDQMASFLLRTNAILER
ncbi:MAG: M15 family metallopeptidase [Acidimicrobiia bacterium]